jgi:hypothetical protein
VRIRYSTSVRSPSACHSAFEVVLAHWIWCYVSGGWLSQGGYFMVPADLRSRGQGVGPKGSGVNKTAPLSWF